MSISTSRFIAAALSAAVLFTAGVARAGQFTLREASAGTVYGPFPDAAGSRVTLAGASYAVGRPGNGLMTFTPTEGGRVYGPLKMVEGRNVVIGGAMYAYHSFGKQPIDEGRAASSAVPRSPSASSEFAALNTPPPPRPVMIEIPSQEIKPSAPTLNLPALPKNEKRVVLHGWLSPVDNTKVDWKLNSARGASSDIKRTAFGIGARYDGLIASVAFLSSVKGGSILDGGTDIDSASVGSGNGFRAEIGYEHPFLKEGGWTVGAAVRGVVERDSCDLNSRTLVGYGADEEIDGNIVYEYSYDSSDISMTEFVLWLDFSIDYAFDEWGIRTALSLQPIGTYNISGSIPCDDGGIDVKCDRKLPLGAGFGIWRDISSSVRIFADVSVGSDTAFKVGARYEF